MTPSILGQHMLPDSHSDASLLASENRLRFKTCRDCHKSLNSPHAAKTPAGWRETQISGMCEPCFDALFEEPEA